MCKIILNFLLFLLILLEKVQANDIPKVNVEVSKAHYLEVMDKFNTFATLISSNSVDISSEKSGKVKRILFTEGSTVKQGNIIVELDERDFAAQVKKAEYALELVKKDLDRKRELLKKGNVSRLTFDEALYAKQEAEEDLRVAVENLEKTRIIAPMNGIIGIKKINIGDYIQEGAKITTLENTEMLNAKFSIPQKYLNLTKLGQDIVIKADYLPNREFLGKVFAIDSAIDPQTRTLQVKAKIDDLNNELKPGSYVSLNVILNKKKILVIPELAIIHDNDQQYVFIVLDGVAKLVPINIGKRYKENIEVLDGIKEGDIVITAGNFKLIDGTAINILEEDKKEQEK